MSINGEQMPIESVWMEDHFELVDSESKLFRMMDIENIGKDLSMMKCLEFFGIKLIRLSFEKYG